MPNELVQAGRQSFVEPFKRFALGLVELFTALFALMCELILHRVIGRRYFTLLGLLGAYLVWSAGTSLVGLFQDFQSWKPTLGFVATPGQRDVMTSRVVHSVRRDSMLRLFLRSLLVLGVCHKLAMQWRKMKGDEPEITTYSGNSRLEPLFEKVGYFALHRLARSPDEAVKRWLEPLCCYLVARFVIRRYLDPTLGGCFEFSAICLAIRAHLSFLRHQWAIDDVADTQAIWKSRFQQIGDNRDSLATSPAMPATVPQS